MTHWSEKYVGTPYVPETGDCAALAERVALEVFGKRVDLPTEHATTYRAQARQIQEHKDAYARRIDRPVDGCPAIFIGRGQTCHIGVMCRINHQWWVLHASQSAGAVVRRRLTDVIRSGLELEGVYEWL